MNKQFSRRHFLQLSSTALTLSPLLPAFAASPANTVNIENMIVINALGGLSNQNLWATSQGNNNESVGKSSIRRMRSIDSRAIKDTHESGTTAINATLGYVAGAGEPYEYTINDIAEWNSIILQYPNDFLKIWKAFHSILLLVLL